ncbi:MAG: ATP-dependent DNA helicase RecG [Armatimonadetes bacterium]|nr:ATP-dependent DNA helicase RecG [Armatimonadota bacterium]
MAGVEGGQGLHMEAQFLKGVGPKQAMLLAKLGLHTVADVLWYLPRRYDDRTNLPKLVALRPGESQSVRGRLRGVQTRQLRGGKVMIQAILDDGTGQVVLTWFNQPWIARQLQKVEGEVMAYGAVKEGLNRRLEIASPEWEEVDEDDDSADFARIVPVYALSEGIPQRTVRKAAASAVEFFGHMVEDPLPEEFLRANRLIPLRAALKEMHRPESLDRLERARHRLVYDEFLYLQLVLQMRRNAVQQEVGIGFPLSRIGSLDVTGGGGLFAQGEPDRRPLREQCAALLPFELTGAQQRVVDEIWRDMERPFPMNRLVQGDVGSGKTAVAACAILGAVRCGYQAALMAPTEILAEQHYINLRRLFEPMGIAVNLLVGKLGARDKRRALERAASGTAQLTVGTHALISDGVAFARLGLVVIDEQHRFGVMQRLSLRQKAVENPDVLVMTATPIPRTLTMSLYGDLDLSVIDELPPGRKPVKTHWKSPAHRDQVYETVRDLVRQGRQAYFVCPMIAESDKMQTQAAEDLHYRLSSQTYPELKVGLLHGQMKAPEKESAMDQFRSGETDVLVSTVAIEVGVDVPNASVMVVEDANRFGLSQLHQLRGRVGRGAHQSYCILIADATNPESERRLAVLQQTSDGFRIAEEDLKIRGPGDMLGTRQSGMLEFKVADLLRDGSVLEQARQGAIAILETDPDLSQPRHRLILEEIRKRRSDEAMVSVS